MIRSQVSLFSTGRGGSFSRLIRHPAPLSLGCSILRPDALRYGRIACSSLPRSAAALRGLSASACPPCTAGNPGFEGLPMGSLNQWVNPRPRVSMRRKAFLSVWTELSLPEYYVNKYKQQGSVARAKAGELAHPRDHRLLAASDARHRATVCIINFVASSVLFLGS